MLLSSSGGERESSAADRLRARGEMQSMRDERGKEMMITGSQGQADEEGRC